MDSELGLLQTMRALAFVIALCLADRTVAGSQPNELRIEEASFVTIGGIQQWVTIRGANRRNPILLIVHGGPGGPQSPYVNTYAPYESDFVLVQWDQRGAGNTFAPNRNAVASLTLERMTQDGIELAAYLRKHLRQTNLVVLGHSWGTILATEMVIRRPQLFSAYVGTGQVSSWQAMASAQWTPLRTQALKAEDEATLTRLQQIEPPDFRDAQQYFSWRAILNRSYLGAADTAYRQELRELTNRSALNPMEIQELGEGATFSTAQLLKVVMTSDLVATASRMPLPFYVIQGREDLYAPTAPAIEYFNGVHAPKKQLIIIEKAGHFALVTHQKEFLNALASLGLTRSRH